MELCGERLGWYRPGVTLQGQRWVMGIMTVALGECFKWPVDKITWQAN